MKEHLLIYLVDDDEDDRIFFEEALSEIPIANTILSFSNGVDLIAHLLTLSDRLPDVLFIDLNMPLMNGEECIIDIRGDDKLSDIPIVVYSTFCDDKQLENLKELGADRFLQKPNTFKRLKEKLVNVLKTFTPEHIPSSKSDSFLID